MEEEVPVGVVIPQLLVVLAEVEVKVVEEVRLLSQGQLLVVLVMLELMVIVIIMEVEEVALVDLVLLVLDQELLSVVLVNTILNL